MQIVYQNSRTAEFIEALAEGLKCDYIAPFGLSGVDIDGLNALLDRYYSTEENRWTIIELADNVVILVDNKQLN